MIKTDSNALDDQRVRLRISLNGFQGHYRKMAFAPFLSMTRRRRAGVTILPRRATRSRPLDVSGPALSYYSTKLLLCIVLLVLSYGRTENGTFKRGAQWSPKYEIEGNLTAIPAKAPSKTAGFDGFRSPLV